MRLYIFVCHRACGQRIDRIISLHSGLPYLVFSSERYVSADGRYDQISVYDYVRIAVVPHGQKQWDNPVSTPRDTIITALSLTRRRR